MKRILLVLLVVISTVSMYAKDVDQSKAKQVARNFAVQRDRRANQLQLDVVYSHPMPNTRDAAFYVVNLGETGFVIVSANDVAHPVIGYSFDRPWPTEGNIPPQITDYLDDLAGQIEAASTQTPDRGISSEWQELMAINPNNPPQPKGNRTEVGPLLTTTWDQGQYYNAMCPEDANGPDGHALTGCVATAMAQIINYWENPTHGRGTHSYESNYGTLFVNFAESNYDYANMPDALTNESSDAQVNAVAKLMSDCGIAVNMGYSAGESGAFVEDVRCAMISFYGFVSSMGFTQRVLYSDEIWEDSLRANIDRSEPVYYSGDNAFSSHAFVLDGYNQDGYFHFNFGWSGNSDGWFLTKAINAGLSFNDWQSAIMGIRPDNKFNSVICHKNLGGNNSNEYFVVTEPNNLFHLRGGSNYIAANELIGTRTTLHFMPEESDGQLVFDVLEFNNNQSVAIYDGIYKDSLVRVIETRGNGGILYEGLPSDTVFENRASTDISPIVSSRHGFTIVSYSYGGMREGFHLQISDASDCRMVSNLTAVQTNDGVLVSWTENGDATQWEVMVGDDSYLCDETHMLLTSLSPNNTYNLKVRAVCDEQNSSSWNSIIVNKKSYWTDVVKSEPEGYFGDGNIIRISSAEGLAWIAHYLDSLWVNDINYIQYSNNVISIENDLDLEGYYWEPIRFWFGNIEGNGHVISNMIVDSWSDNNNDRGYGGLFQYLDNNLIRNLGLLNCRVNALGSSGSIAGWISNCSVSNCFSEGYLIWAANNGPGGGLFGSVVNSQIINCYAYGDLNTISGYGGLAGYVNNSMFVNCVSSLGESFNSSDFYGGVASWRGLITGQVYGGNISNCFADISVAKRSWSSDDPEYVAMAKRAYFLGDVYDIDAIINLVAFNISIDHFGTLLPDTALNYTLGENMDVVTALNDYVYELNSPEYRTWVRDDVTHVPVFGNYYEPSCYNPTNLAVTNANVIGDPTIRTQLSWTQIGEPDHWEVLYVEAGGNLNDGVIVSVDSNPCEITGIPVGAKFDFYVRAICDDENISAWSAPVNYSQDMQRWIDIVNTQPESYTIDPDGTALISCAEDLVWWTKQGCNDNAKLVSDIDLGEYKWQPISWFGNKLDGDNHFINNLIIIEDESSNWIGLFGELEGVVSNLGIKNCIVYGGVRVGAIFGDMSGGEVINCYVIDGSINGDNIVGGIGGSISGGSVSNCYANNQITSCWIGKNGVLIGEMLVGTVRNCYGTNNYPTQSYGNTNTLVGWMDSGSVLNCYSKNPYMVNGYVREGQASVSDTASFIGQGLDWTLNTPVLFEEVEVTDLCQALNMGVIAMNNDKYKLWVPDSAFINYGYPVFGNFYTVTCPNVEDVTVKNVTVEGENAVVVSWTAKENTSMWQIKYRRHNLTTDPPVVINTISNHDTLFNIPLTFEYDFNVRTVCSDTDYSGWSNTVTEVVDLPYWTEIVTSQPQGYTEDESGKVFISSAEGLAWLAANSKGAGAHYNGREVSLLCDIDISDYRWYPIGVNDGWFAGSFNGNGYKISGIHLNSNEFAHCGLFGVFSGNDLQNVTLDGGTVVNKDNKDGSNTSTGGLVGLLNYYGIYNTNTVVNNCHSSVQVEGVYNVGGLCGMVYTSHIINSSATGTVQGGFECGGLIGVSAETQIINSYATGNVIHNNNKNGAWCLGGLIGQSQVDHIYNCYSSGNIVYSMEPRYVGKVIGSYDADIECYNLYGQHDDLLPNMFGDYLWVPLSGGSFHDTTLFNNDCALATPITINNTSYTNLLLALNAWVDANDTNGEYLHWVADTENLNGGFPMLERLSSTTYQVQNLVQGWNWWSTYIEQDGVEGMQQLQNSLGNNGMQIKSQTAVTQYLVNNTWFGSLTTLENEKSYRIKTSTATDIVMRGASTNPANTPITLHPNWTWIGYPVTTSQGVAAAMNGFEPQEGDVIKSQSSSSIYMSGSWFPPMNLVPGQGYLYKSNATEDRTLTFSESRGEAIRTDDYRKHWDNDPHAFADNMTIIAVVSENGEYLYKENVEVGAFVKGENRGSVKLQYFEPMDKYYAVLTVNGEEGEIVHFGIVDRNTETENLNCGNSVVFSSNNVVGAMANPYEIGFGSEATTGLSLSPNPVGKNEEVRLELPSDVKVVEAVVTDMLGRVIRHETIQTNRIAGMSESGVYNVQVVTDKGIYHGRIIVK